MDRILVTGGSGYVGQPLIHELISEGHALNVVGRCPFVMPAGDVRFFQISSISKDTDWRPALAGCSRVIHLAGQVPAANQTEQDFHDVNDFGTARLVKCILSSDVEQVIMASSLAAVGGNKSDVVLDEGMASVPSTTYGRSKRAAEKHIEAMALSGRSGIAIRFPSIYSSTAGGYWKQIMSLAASGCPLPFGGVHNRRSMISLTNVKSCLKMLVERPARLEQSGAYFVADGTSVSLCEVLTWLRKGMGRPPMLIPIPAFLLSNLLALLGQGHLSASLLENLEIDCRKFENAFGWTSPMHPKKAFMLAGAEYMKQKKSKA